MADDLSTPDTRRAAVTAVVEAYAALDEVNQRRPIVDFWHRERARSKEENGFGPKVRRMFEA